MTSTSLRLAAFFLLAGPSAAFAVVASPAKDLLVRPPSAATPAKASLAGAFASFEMSSGELAQGLVQVGVPFELPAERGASPLALRLAYADGRGASEWGQHWALPLRIVRWRETGPLDYETDDLMSPWGRLRRGKNGRWYPLGLLERVVVDEVDGALVARLPDGSQQTFGSTTRVESDGGSYAWYLDRVEDVAGHKASLDYDSGPENLPILREMRWGGLRAGQEAYRLRVISEKLRSPFADYASGRRREIRHRITELVIEARVGERWTERYRYELRFDDVRPAFRLASVTKKFSSGASEPAVRFTYGAAEGLVGREPVAAADVGGVVRALGEGALDPRLTSLADFDDDGRLDFEYGGSGHPRVVLGQGLEKLNPARDAEAACVPGRSESPSPRSWLPMLGVEQGLKVVALVANERQSTLFVCRGDGHPVAKPVVVDGAWELGRNAQLADVDRDGKPDLVQYEGGEAGATVSVLRNLSSGAEAKFGKATVSRLRGGFAPHGFWLADVNGDGLVDLVTRSTAYFAVYAGTGDGRFETEFEILEPRLRGGEALTELERFFVNFSDVDGDGYGDAVLSANDFTLVLRNEGGILREIPTTAFDRIPAPHLPMVGDFGGSSSLQALFVTKDGARSVELGGPDVGSLRSVDDGKGTRIVFERERAEPARGRILRPRRLATLMTESAGRPSQRTRFIYGETVVREATRAFLGFRSVERRAPHVSERSDYVLLPELPPFVRRSESRDPVARDLVRFQSTDARVVTLEGVPVFRVEQNTEGWTAEQGKSELSSTTFHRSWSSTLCPTQSDRVSATGTLATTVTLAKPRGLTAHLHCLSENITVVGRHSDKTLDFRHQWTAVRDARGRVERLTANAGDDALPEQEVHYDGEGRVEWIRTPENGRSSFFYDELGRLSRIERPDGVVERTVKVDGTTDQPLEMEVDRGAGQVDRQEFRYDELERLTKSWSSVAETSESAPSSRYQYTLPTRTTLGSVSTETLVAASKNRARVIEYLSPGGEVLGNARETDTGWAFGNFSERKSPGTTALWIPSAVRERAPPVVRRAEDLVADATAIQRSSRGVVTGSGDETTELGRGHRKRARVELRLEKGGLYRETLVEDQRERLEQIDDEGRSLSVEDGERRAYSFRYDVLGRFRRATLSDGKRHAVDYDEFGRRSRVFREGIGGWRLHYRPTSKLVRERQRLDRDGTAIASITEDHDFAGRVIARVLKGKEQGEERRYKFLWGKSEKGTAGLLESVEGPDYRKDFAYRPDGSPRHRSVRVGGQWEISVHNAYGKGGVVESVTTEVRDAKGKVIAKSLRSHEWDGLGRIRKTSFGGGAEATYRFDDEGRVAGVDFGKNDALDFAFDATTHAREGFRRGPDYEVSFRSNDRGLLGEEKLRSGRHESARDYGYNNASYLETSKDPHLSFRYAYGDDGLPSSLTQDGEELSVEEAKGNWLLHRKGKPDERIELDPAGRVRAFAGGRAVYSADDRPIEFVRGRERWRYAYDENGERIGRQKAGETWDVFADGLTLVQGHLLEPVYAAGLLVGVSTNGAFERVDSDLRGTVVRRGKEAPSWPSPYGYRPKQPSGAVAVAFAGHGYDDTLQSYRVGVRDLDPVTARFLTPDPLFLAEPERCVESPAECSLYGFARNAPTSWTDQGGTFAQMILPAIALVGFGAWAVDEVQFWKSVNSPNRPTVFQDPRSQGLRSEGMDLGPAAAVAGAQTAVGAARGLASAAAVATRHASRAWIFAHGALRSARTAENTAVFWSGPLGESAAKEFAQATGRTLLEMTPVGKWAENSWVLKYADKFKLTRQDTRKLWEFISSRFAKLAKGDVHAFEDLARDPAKRADSVFRTVELPILQQRADVNLRYHGVSQP